MIFSICRSLYRVFFVYSPSTLNESIQLRIVFKPVLKHRLCSLYRVNGCFSATKGHASAQVLLKKKFISYFSKNICLICCLKIRSLHFSFVKA